MKFLKTTYLGIGSHQFQTARLPSIEFSVISTYAQQKYKSRYISIVCPFQNNFIIYSVIDCNKTKISFPNVINFVFDHGRSFK